MTETSKVTRYGGSVREDSLGRYVRLSDFAAQVRWADALADEIALLRKERKSVAELEEEVLRLKSELVKQHDCGCGELRALMEGKS